MPTPTREQQIRTGPIGRGEYAVRAGDCISSVACDHGHHWRTIWDHPENQELKNVRKDPNILLEGDRLNIPALALKEVSCGADARHRFVRKGVPERLHLTLFDSIGEPRANLRYRVTIDGRLQEGTTDSEGRLEIGIPPNAKVGVLVVVDGSHEESFNLHLGHLDPPNEVTGVQGRLRNIGLPCGQIDGELGPRTRQALQRFQQRYNLPPTGELDEETRRKLVQVHGF
jgi:hypothetical protein